MHSLRDFRHAPRLAYAEFQERFHGTKLREPVETRWGSKVQFASKNEVTFPPFQVDLAISLVANRQVVENALLKLRADKFEFKGRELMYLWDPDWWQTAENICEWMSPMLRFVLGFRMTFWLLVP